MSKFYRSIKTVFLAGVMSLSASTVAAQISWSGNIDNNWFNIKNWSPQIVPTASDGIIVGGDAVAGQGVFIDGGSLTTLNQCSVDFLNLEVGLTGQGQVNANDGSTINTDCAIFGKSAGSLALVTADQLSAINVNDGIFAARGDAIVAFKNGSGGTLDQTCIGLWHNAGGGLNLISQSNVNTTGVLTAGAYGSSDLVVNSGATLYSTDAILAQGPGSTSNAAVSGGAQWIAEGAIMAGLGGHAEIEVTGGGIITAEELLMASNFIENCGSANLSISGMDSSVIINGDAYLAENGEATINVSDGGTFFARDCYMAISARDEYIEQDDEYVLAHIPSQCHMNLTDTESCFRNLIVGAEGNADLTANNTTLNVADRLYISRNAGSASTLHLTGGSTLNVDELFIGGGAIVTEDDSPSGELEEIRQDGQLIVDDINCTINISGGLEMGMFGSFSGVRFTNTPNHTGIIFNMNNAYWRNRRCTNLLESTWLEATLRFTGQNNTYEVDSLPYGFSVPQGNWNSYSVLNVDIEPDAKLTLVNDIVNVIPEYPTYKEFENANIGAVTLNEGAVLDLNGYGITCDHFVLNGGTVIANGGYIRGWRKKGDFNYDNKVDMLDFLIFRASYGKHIDSYYGDYCPADMDENDYVNMNDFLIFRAEYIK